MKMIESEMEDDNEIASFCICHCHEMEKRNIRGECIKGCAGPISCQKVAKNKK